MLQIMQDVPRNVVGVRALGKVTKEDYEQTLLPEIKRVSDTFGSINFLMVLETDVSNFTMGAWIQDAKMSLQQFTKWNKIAIVTDQKIIQKLSHLFAFVSPADARGFPVSDIELAKVWITTSKEV